MDSSRLIPISIAGAICFFTAFLLGAVFWYFFGSTRIRLESGVVNLQANNNAVPSNVNAVSEVPTANANVEPLATPEIKLAPAGEIRITSGEITISGEIRLPSKIDKKVPLRRVSVDEFLIGETEVTNAQYAAFISSTGHAPPIGWDNADFVPRKKDDPVAGVTWSDANDYCTWLSEELAVEVRLPTEAQWIRAARGDTGFKFPWGNDWDKNASPNADKIGNVFPVKSLTAGRSPFGVYEMVGNVWEWMDDLAVDEFNEPILSDESKLRIIKGGSAFEDNQKFMTIDARLTYPEEKAFTMLGFRYVINRR